MARRAIRDEIAKHTEDYNQWVQAKYGNLIKETGQIADDLPSGRKWVPHNLKNVVRIMRRELRGGEGFTGYGVGPIRALVTKQFKNIKDIQASRDKIITKEEMVVRILIMSTL